MMYSKAWRLGLSRWHMYKSDTANVGSDQELPVIRFPPTPCTLCLNRTGTVADVTSLTLQALHLHQLDNMAASQHSTKTLPEYRYIN